MQRWTARAALGAHSRRQPAELEEKTVMIERLPNYLARIIDNGKVLRFAEFYADDYLHAEKQANDGLQLKPGEWLEIKVIKPEKTEVGSSKLTSE
ncbi:MAG: hypothetical protein ACI845_003423 [Gammaproteobacteria bacterium]